MGLAAAVINLLEIESAFWKAQEAGREEISVAKRGVSVPPRPAYRRDRTNRHLLDPINTEQQRSNSLYTRQERSYIDQHSPGQLPSESAKHRYERIEPIKFSC